MVHSYINNMEHRYEDYNSNLDVDTVKKWKKFLYLSTFI